ncbi:hypothetical protein HLM50_10535 [Sulfitobacter sp. Ks41]|uniref:hypothetical protein n=1 Tax=Sulfitobacter sp. Ks41 TaxID=2731139 RepID=UPI0023E2504B|nr:hypothetical protein [Sulfitobacter sp. Ks41]MDF3361497.1 hypothetical protein [Sulfitobacter sp. Ks41]
MLRTARLQNDSQNLYASETLKEYAFRYGKSSHTIRKIVDATAWVEGFYPELIASPPEKFPLTQALQLRAIYRLDPDRAKEIAPTVFAGKLTGRELTEILDEVKEGRYLPQSDPEVSLSRKKVARMSKLESRVQALLGSMLYERGMSAQMEVRPGVDIRPQCDFVISDSGTPKIAVEVKAYRSQPSTMRLLELLGAFLLWQSKGLNVWLFLPDEASAGINELHSMIAEGGLHPIEIFLVGREGVTQHKAPGQEL